MKTFFLIAFTLLLFGSVTNAQFSFNNLQQIASTSDERANDIGIDQ